MTKVTFDPYTPLPGYKDAPLITAEQMSRFLYSGIGSRDAKAIADLLNGPNACDYTGQLAVTYEPPATHNHGFEIGSIVYYCGPAYINQDWVGKEIRIVAGDWLRGEMVSEPGRHGAFTREQLTADITKSTGYKPKFLPIDRPVRVHDLEPGDILRFCGEPCGDCGGNAVLGNEYTVIGVGCSRFYTNIPGWGDCPMSGKGWSFVRRPFRAGETVAYKDQSQAWKGFEGMLLVDTNQNDLEPGFGIWVTTYNGITGSIAQNMLKRVP